MKCVRSRLLPILGLALSTLLASSASAQVVAGRYGYARPSYERSSTSLSTYVSSRIWVPGCYQTVHERVWVPGRTERVWVEPVFEWRLGPCGSRLRVLVCAGRWQTVHHPGHYETRAVQVWRPGYWTARGCP